MGARQARRPAYTKPRRPRKRRDPDDSYSLLRSGRHVAFRWDRFVRALSELFAELGGAFWKRLGINDDPSRPRREPDPTDETPPEPSIWPRLIWRTTLIAILVGLYLWCGPVHRVVDTTVGGAYDAILDEIHSPSPGDTPPTADQPDDGTLITIRVPGHPFCYHSHS